MFFLFRQAAQGRRGKERTKGHLRVEELEPRLVLSLGLAGPSANDAAVKQLTLVALHEMGHALGLSHNSDPNSIMYSDYNPNYDLANFALDPAVKDLKALYSGPNTGPWKDALDPNPGNGKIEIGYSFVPDGTQLDKGKSTLFATFNGIFGSSLNWEPIFVAALNKWAGVATNLSFYSRHDAGLPFNYPGRSQNDPNSGDIRIGAEPIGTNDVYAETFFPPPNEGTGAGDSYYNTGIAWGRRQGLTWVTTDTPSGVGGQGGGSGSSSTGGSGTPQSSNLVNVLGQPAPAFVATVTTPAPSGPVKTTATVVVSGSTSSGQSSSVTGSLSGSSRTAKTASTTQPGSSLVETNLGRLPISA
jgi:hypothetical protein